VPCYCPDIQQGKLIAQSDTRGCIEIGSDDKVTLNLTETVKLFMNDVKDTDENNDGELSVNWSIDN